MIEVGMKTQEEVRKSARAPVHMLMENEACHPPMVTGAQETAWETGRKWVQSLDILVSSVSVL